MLRVGTDCSGIEAPIQALMMLDIPFKHVFSSDINKQVIKSIKANYSPGIIFGDPEGKYPNGDITQRNIKDVPNIDLYIAGFPCQTFSTAGKRKGFEDVRGTVFFSCWEVIKVKKPKFFILENVKGLVTHDSGNTFDVIKYKLNELTGYIIEWKVLNTKDYGVPQNRERLFIVGIKHKKASSGDPFSKDLKEGRTSSKDLKEGSTSSKDLKEGSTFFEWPEKREMEDLRDYVDWDDTHKDIMPSTLKTHIHRFNKTPAVYIDYGFVKFANFYKQDKYSPCLTTSNGMWNLLLHRYTNINEYMMLQSFPLDFNVVVSNIQMKKQLGNSMSVNVLYELFLMLFTA